MGDCPPASNHAPRLYFRHRPPLGSLRPAVVPYHSSVHLCRSLVDGLLAARRDGMACACCDRISQAPTMPRKRALARTSGVEIDHCRSWPLCSSHFDMAPSSFGASLRLRGNSSRAAAPRVCVWSNGGIGGERLGFERPAGVLHGVGAITHQYCNSVVSVQQCGEVPPCMQWTATQTFTALTCRYTQVQSRSWIK